MLPKTLPFPAGEPNRDDYPRSREHLPGEPIEHGKYVVRFARDGAELERILRLRFQVFNQEMGEGLEASETTGLDRDVFDSVCHHLLVVDRSDGQVVGTYRLQTGEMARAHHGYYSAGEFDLSVLPPEVAASTVELGRACIAIAHRNRQVLFLLWKGLAQYLAHNRKRFLFGCSSLTSQDPLDGHRMLAYLGANGHLHPTLAVPPLPGFECSAAGLEEPPRAVHVPKLFRSYLRYGASICGAPAIDREFKTIDFFMLFDLAGLDERRYRLFFGEDSQA